MSSLGCKALCVVISFLFLLSILESSSLFHIKNFPKYLTMRSAKIFIPFIRFLLVSSSFLVLQIYSFLIIFLSSPLVWWSQPYNIPWYLYLSFSQRCQYFSWIGSPIPTVLCRFQLFFISMAYFSYQILSLCPDRISSMPDLVFQFFSIFVKNFVR